MIRPSRLEPEDSLVHQVLMATAIHDLAAGNNRRSLLMDAAEYTTTEELLALAADEKGWAERESDRLIQWTTIQQQKWCQVHWMHMQTNAMD